MSNQAYNIRKLKVKEKKPLATTLGVMVGLGGLFVYNYFLSDLVRVKVKINKEKLSSISLPIPVQIDTPPYFEIVMQNFKIDPKSIALRFYKVMDGLTTFDEAHVKMYKEILSNYTYNDLRAIHNAWLKFVDSKLSLYDWINSETVNFGEESELQPKVLMKLNQAGVGKRNVIKIPVSDYLKK